MSDTVKKSIPSWQRSETPPSPAQAEPENPAPTESPAPAQNASEARATLLDEARRFLDDDSIRGAAPEHKTAFLKSKGVQSEEIQKLFQVELPRQKEQESTSPSKPPSASIPPPNNPSPIPPIITYPEFLLRPPKPAPIVTIPRVINTFSALGAATTLIYGASKYLIAPMLDSLTSSRHSLFETAIANLATLNEKLEGAVSSVPKDPWITIEGDDDATSTASDPTELFHRDVGVQTEMPPSPTSDLEAPSDAAKSLQETHFDTLQSLERRLRDVLNCNEDVLDEDVETGTKVAELKLYMDGLERKPAFQVQYGHAVRQDEEPDEIAKVRAEIRGVKGALLSARNFPGGVKR